MGSTTGKVYAVTGSNSGIGREIALALAGMGATVVMVVRDQEKGRRAQAEIVKQTGNKSVDLMVYDLSSMEQVRKLAETFKSKYNRLDVLVNNAGAVFSKRQVTKEGFERTLAVNYLAPFLLTHELLGLLKASAPSRVVNISSGLAKDAKVDLDDLQSEKDYNGMNVYAKTKLLLMMFTYQLARQLEGTGVIANVALPGFVATNLGRNSGSLRSAILFRMVRPMQISAKKGAETPVYLATSEEVQSVTGKCFRNKEQTATCTMSYDQELQERLWRKTQSMLGIS